MADNWFLIVAHWSPKNVAVFDKERNQKVINGVKSLTFIFVPDGLQEVPSVLS